MSNPCEKHFAVKARDYCPVCLINERDALKEENRKLNVQLHYYKTVSYSLHRHVTQLRLECQALKHGWVDRKDETTDYEKTLVFLDSLGIRYKVDEKETKIWKMNKSVTMRNPDDTRDGGTFVFYDDDSFKWIKLLWDR